MSRKLLILVLAFSAVLLFSSVAMAAPRVDPDGMTIDAGLQVNWASAGVVGDLNMPIGKVGLRVIAELGYMWLGYWGYGSGMDLGLTGTVMYPVLQEKEFELGVYGGLRVGYDHDFYMGLAVGLAVEAPINSQWTVMGELMYAPGIYIDETGVYPAWNHGGYGIYGVYELNADYTLNFGVRSIGLLPGFTVGLTF